MIGSVGSYSNGGRAIQRPPMGVDYKMSTEQKSKLKEILAEYSSKDTSEEGMQAMKNEIQAAGIRPGGDLGTALHAAGFKVGPPPERGASGGGGPEGPERAGNDGDADDDRGAVGAGPQRARSLRAPKGVSEAQGANTQPPQGGPQDPKSGASGVLVQPPQFIRDFMSKLQERSPTDSDLADFIKNLRAQNEQASGFLFNQTA